MRIERRRRFCDETSGALVVEFGLIVPILFFLVFGGVDFSRAYFTMNNLAAAVREGARYGAVLDKPGVAPWPDSIKQRTTNFAYTFGGAALTSSQVTSVFDGTGGTLTVTATYTFRPITPLVNLIGLDSIPMRQTAVFRWEGTPAPAP